MARFEPSRPDGRSDKRVIFELVRDADPETAYSFDDLGRALSAGLSGPVTKVRISRAVRAANRLLLQEQRRYLVSVRGVGYRIIRADEHVALAIDRRTRADTQIQQSMDILRYVRLDELSPVQAALHRQQLVIVGVLYQATRALERRQARQEEAIEQLHHRLAAIETGRPAGA